LSDFTTFVSRLKRQPVEAMANSSARHEVSMSSDSFIATASGVRVANDFRDNLIIDRHDPVFATMRASKVKHLRSENSEDAVTWNVFRSLRQINPTAWLPTLTQLGLPGISIIPDEMVTVDLWRRVMPPPNLVRHGDEGASEIDVVIESPLWVWFIESKYHSDISIKTTTRPLRNQILRNIDVGSYYAGVRTFFFSLLVGNPEQSPLGADTISKYADLSEPRKQLAEHRPDGLANLCAVSLLTWSNLGTVLKMAKNSATRSEEQSYADRAIQWLDKKKLL
jgi:hypothetical protein